MRFKGILLGNAHDQIADLISIVLLRDKKDCFLRLHLTPTEIIVAPQDFSSQSEFPLSLHLFSGKVFTSYRIESCRGNVIDLYCAGKLLQNAFLASKGGRQVELKLAKMQDGHPCLSLKADLPGYTKTMLLETLVPVRVLEECAPLSPPRLAEPAFQLEVPIKRLNIWLNQMNSIPCKFIDFNVQLHNGTGATVAISTKREDIGLDLRAVFLQLPLVEQGKENPPPATHGVKQIPLKSLHNFVSAHLNIGAPGPHMACFIDNKAVSLYTAITGDIGFITSYTFSVT